MTTFKEAYGVLSRHATTLRNQQEPNIDDLLNIVTESVEAYKVCKQRIDAVEEALEKALADPEVAAAAPGNSGHAAGPAPAPPSAPRQARAPAAPSPSAPSAPRPPEPQADDMDDDIPF